MPKTFAEKVLSKKTGIDAKAGDIVIAKPDFIMSHDNSSAISKTFKKIGVEKVKYPERIVIILDHCVPAATEKYAQNHKEAREFVKEQAITNFFDINRGVCHQVLPEEGFALPGTLILGSDSHTTTYGAFGSFSAGIGRTEAAAIWATGELWLKVPEAMKIIVSGNFQKKVSAKDFVLKIISDIRSDGADYMSVEFFGEGLNNLSISDRMTIANMAAEMGAKNCFFPPNDEVLNYFKNIGKLDFEIMVPDENAAYARELYYNLNEIEPMLACPHTVDNVLKVSEKKGLEFHQGLIGTCTNGREDDLLKAAAILKGKKINKNIRLLIFPASNLVFQNCLKNGTIQVLSEAGAVIMNPGCGPCLGAHEGTLAPGEICLSTANRNFKGRMGCKEAEVYLASPETVAASALSGKIEDPRNVK
ncbi:MAG: 3-isopropylmalate dehydratase large subunit [Pseudomonadota bacterium]